ncbi:LuxR C-terminal-related transcriptional regulator [Bradyrhizobium sp. SSUT18]|uniref:LuxR C-terminal-related transcriptional regulator n=1 Tax=Bradyrhizobium sp. SSUT18 TaxID=3040602 RepID=UPI00244BA491|nr:LuxR C-terminal-related transcriptional regulator [Bradyrhizobium sp. SSUT18]MDH2404838.1 LuxR C-terminal-related transcriptional regulator [Bradyrhizobium sp. SSUT18]
MLSPREHECLEWSARGKSAGEIGIILGIESERRDFTWTTRVRSSVLARFAKPSCC